MPVGKAKPVFGGHVVAMPYPGRGHINPMMNLCTLLAARKEMITITFVLTEEWLDLIGSLPNAPNIRVITIPNVIPSEHNRAADFAGFVTAVNTRMEAPFDRLLDQLEPPVSCIIADIYLRWVLSAGSHRNIPVVSLCPVAPSVFSDMFHQDFDPEEDLPGVLKYALEAFSSASKAQAIIFTSFYELQPRLTSCLRAKLTIPIYTIGPCIPYLFLREPSSNPIPDNHHPAYMDWLDSQPHASVLYVSLGSFLSISNEQLLELSMGLHASMVRYLWIARGDALSLQEANGDEKGLIVPWCDQLNVLCHSSVSGFLTHCGWNSTMESIFAGVPMLTFPLAFDQIHNSKLIVEDWRVGLALKSVEGAENVVGREEIAQAVKMLMDLNGDEGKEFRRRAKELQETCQRAIEAGGSTENNINSFSGKFFPGPIQNAD